GLVTVTKVINKYVLVFASVILLIAGFVPKVAALLTTIPYAVIGGATISVFASISMTGIRMIASQEMTPRNTGVVGTALAFG
ncbi:solute carrier family 23 protein, partial [Enterococcus faecium]